MAAGSVISAMAGEQSLDRMAASSARCRSPTRASSSAAWRWPASRPSRASSPRTRSWPTIGARGGGWWVFYVAGYVGAILTAVYTWRMIFRAFWGEPCPEARELEEGHLHHAEAPFNPANGEIEDTDVGFPGPEHHIAERAVPMKVAMGVLAVLARGRRPHAGAVGRLGGVEKFLEPAFADSTPASRPQRRPHRRSAWCSAPCSALGRHLHRLPGLGRAAGHERAHPASASRCLHGCSSTSGTSTRSSTSLVVRPWAWVGRFGQQTFERVVVNGVFVGGTTGIVKAGLGGRAGAAERLPARLRRAAGARDRRAWPSTS